MLILFRKALLLGAGFVTKPTLDILSEAGVQVTVGEEQIHIPMRSHTLGMSVPI